MTYRPKDVCALVGSTFYVDCTYTFPSHLYVKTTFWHQGCSSDGEREDLGQNCDFAGRLTYLGDKNNNCSLQIEDVRKRDSAEYCFRFHTNVLWEKWSGTPGVYLFAKEKKKHGNKIVILNIVLRFRTTSYFVTIEKRHVTIPIDLCISLKFTYFEGEVCHVLIN